MHKFAILAAIAACTSSGDGPTSEPDAHGGDSSPWLGLWDETGTQSTTCGASSGTTQLSLAVEIVAGVDDGTIETSADNCRLIWNLDGNDASLRAGQVCTVSVNGVDVTVAWTQSTASLSAGIITADTTGATNNGCSFMQQGMLAKQ